MAANDKRLPNFPKIARSRKALSRPTTSKAKREGRLANTMLIHSNSAKRPSGKPRPTLPDSMSALNTLICSQLHPDKSLGPDSRTKVQRPVKAEFGKSVFSFPPLAGLERDPPLPPKRQRCRPPDAKPAVITYATIQTELQPESPSGVVLPGKSPANPTCKNTKENLPGRKQQKSSLSRDFRKSQPAISARPAAPRSPKTT